MLADELEKLEKNDALIRCKTGEMWFLGSGGVQIIPSPGSRHFQMKKARSGHWMLPINKFKKDAKTAHSVLSTIAENPEGPNDVHEAASSSQEAWPHGQ